MYKGLFTAF